MRHYEIVVLVNAEQHERGSAVAARYQSMVADSGGVVHRFEDWGSRRLAYPIGNRLRARYFLFNIECGADILKTLKEDFRYSESVLRSLVIRCERAIAGESPILAELKKSQDEAASEKAAASSDDTAAAGDGDKAAAAGAGAGAAATGAAGAKADDAPAAEAADKVTDSQEKKKEKSNEEK